MVKGVSRRVVVIKSPDRRIFEEAIFIIREDVMKSGGVTAEDIVSEACKVASVYVKRNTAVGLKKYILPAALIAGGVVLTVTCVAILNIAGI